MGDRSCRLAYQADPGRTDAHRAAAARVGLSFAAWAQQALRAAAGLPSLAQAPEGEPGAAEIGSQLVTVRVDLETAEGVDSAVAKSGLSRSAWIRWALDAVGDKRGPT